jgi:tRNA(Ile)-lysidine synthase
VVRPLLELPQSELAAALAASGLRAVRDPTNDDLAVPRNRMRHRVLPALESREPGLAGRLSRLAAVARGARRRLRERLAAVLEPRWVAGRLGLERTALTALPAELRGPALAELHRRAGLPYPARRRAQTELLRQLNAAALGNDRIGCDCGDGWRWESRGTRLTLGRRRPPPPPAAVFAYTFEVPGEIVVPELHLRVRLSFGPVAPWMFEGSPIRAGLELPLEPGDRVEIRNRRPGDRLQPLGAAGSRRLKDVLIERGVPRRQRDRLPLLIVGGRIAWIPGITVEDRFRLTGGHSAWIVEIERA